MKQKLQLRAKPVLLSSLIMVSMILFSSTVFTQVNGTVFRDLPVNGSVVNTYGVKDANELGVEGVTVTVYPGGVSTVTLADGTWGPIGGAGNLRVEFSNWPSYLKESSEGGSKNTSVQFSSGGIVNFGLHNPGDYSEPTPPIVTIHYINGSSTAAGVNNTLESFPFTASGASPARTTEATKAQVGSIWGLAHSKGRNVLYTSSVLKRHVELGPGGLGAIYSTDIAAAENAAVFVTIPNVGTINQAARGLGPIAALSMDTEAFSKTGKTGLGDIDISDDEQFLYVVNLNDKNIYVIDIDAQSIVGNYAIPNPGCSNGAFRPFALSYKDGLVYVGGVCDASVSGDRADLAAYVYAFDPVLNVFNGTPVLTFPLDYVRGGSAWAVNFTGVNGETFAQHGNKWYPWQDTYTTTNFNTFIHANGTHYVVHAQPVFSDIEFASDGTILLGFFDRSGMQFSQGNYLPTMATLEITVAGGDILKGTKNGSNWDIEPHALGTATEFFFADFLSSHQETSNGGIAALPGDDWLYLSAMDPLATTSGGYIRLHLPSGGQPGGGGQGTQVFAGSNTTGFFGKAIGMGDMELLSEPAPIEIGNLVWDDANNDGIQDANESGITGVVVKLFKAGTEIASATTDANGNYIFSNDPNGATTASHIYNIAALVPEMDYIVRIENASGGSKQAALGVNSLTVANIGEGISTDINDSDGSANGNDADATVLAADISFIGANNHTFDFGFSPFVCPPTRCGTVGVVKN